MRTDEVVRGLMQPLAPRPTGSGSYTARARRLSDLESVAMAQLDRLERDLRARRSHR